VETRPVQLRGWLDDLPYVDIAETTVLVLDAASRLNRQPLAPQTRFALLELYSEAYYRITDLVYGAGAETGLQPADSRASGAEPARRLSIEMAFGYKIIVNDSLDQKKLWGKNKALAAAIQRAVRFLGQVLATHFLNHAGHPSNVWREMYQLYRYAEEHQFLKLAIKEPHRPDAASNTIDDTFKQILLIGLADPFALRHGELLDIYRYLEHYAQQAVVTLPEPIAAPVEHFVIDLDSDSRPSSYQQAGTTANAERCRLLKTGRLVHTVHEHLESLHTGKKPESPGLPVQRSIADTIRLLEHVKTTWGAAAMRRYRRQTDHGQVNVASGIRAIYYFLNGCTPFDPARYLKPAAEDSIDLGSQFQSFARIGGCTFDKHLFAVVNVSAGGIALRAPAGARDAMQVGQAVGLQQSGDPNDNAWAIGVVRWFHECGTQEFELGIEFLAPHARHATLRAHTGSRIETEFQEGLLLTSQDPDDEPLNYTLLTASGLYQDGRTLLVDVDNAVAEVRAERRIESTPFFDQFQARAIK